MVGETTREMILGFNRGNLSWMMKMKSILISREEKEGHIRATA